MQIYTFEEALQDSLRYFNNDELAAKAFVTKYALKNKQGEYLETNPDQMHHRLVKEFARIESKYNNPLTEDEIYQLLKDFKYIIPQGSPMSGIGNDYQITSLSNCFVIESATDSYGGIMKTDQEQVQLMKRRGGVGHDLSNLRPYGAEANNSVLTGMAGSTLYMERFSNSTREVSQGGRRGALMLSMSVKHPDAERFIDAKTESGKVTGANISVRITDEFMEYASREDDEYWQTFPIDAKIPMGEDYDKLIIDAKFDEIVQFPNGIYFKKIHAKKLWNKIIHNAWKSAEPGILFWDQIVRESPANRYGDEWMESSTNPCSELPLCQYDSCRLLSINLYSYVDNPFTDNAKFNMYKFVYHVGVAQRLMDDLVDLEIEKINKIITKIIDDPESIDIKDVESDLWHKIRKKAKDGRRTGLGVTAEGDMLAALGIRYGTNVATIFCEHVHREMAIASYTSSIELAKERGSFPIFRLENDDQSPFVQRVLGCMCESVRQDYLNYGRRNIANLTIAPTGTTSLMAQTTSGIEPVFQIYYKRRRKINQNDKNARVDFTDEKGDQWEEYKVFHPKFLEWYRINCIPEYTYNEALSILGGCDDKELNNLIKKSPYNKATALDTDYIKKVELQGKIQQWVDHSISVTVNCPEDTTEETVDKIYKRAFEVGTKGCTIYREGSRDGVLISATRDVKFEYRSATKRPKTLDCDIHYTTVKNEKWMVLVGKYSDLPYEVFGFKIDALKEVINTKYKTGKLIKQKSKTYDLIIDNNGTVKDIVSLFDTPLLEYGTRLISTSLRHHTPVKYIVDQLEKSKSESIGDFAKVMARILKKYVKEDEQIVKEDSHKCPLCVDGILIKQDGCEHCNKCDYSVCG